MRESSPTSPFLPPGSYPQDLETWWLNQAMRHFNLRDPKTTAKRLVNSAGLLSDLFTTQRSRQFADAYTGRLAVLAYGNYFFPQTYVRTQFVLSEWLDYRRGRVPEKSMRILDLGGGSGAAVVSATDLLRSRRPALEFESTVVDASADNLKSFRQLCSESRPRTLAQAKAVQGDLRDIALWKDEKWDLILVSFSLNEAFIEAADSDLFDWVQSALDSLNPQGVLLLLEPALKESSERLERLRDSIAAQTSRVILGPCQHRQACPLLAGRKFWCHDARSWQVPPMVQRINAVLNRTLWDMKYSSLLLGKEPLDLPPPGPNLFRLTSSFTKEKGKLSAMGCAADGSNARYEILRNQIDPWALRVLEKHERGDVLRADSLRALGEPHLYRVEDPKTLQPLFNTQP